MTSISLVNASNCKQPLVRKEWSDQMNRRRAAILGLTRDSTTSRLSTSPRLTISILIREPSALPQYESDLRELCGYNGAQPYWDWSQDTASVETFLASPIFDPTTGFEEKAPFVDSSNANVRLRVPGRTGGGLLPSFVIATLYDY
ncbi:hypothetical protein V2G26_017978 [Clonostachys chloroleuca]